MKNVYTLAAVSSALLASALGLAACSSTTTGTPSKPAVVTTVVVSTVAASEANASSHPAAASSDQTAGNSAAGTFTMPNEVGKVLQDAQDDIQRVSQDPLFYTSSTDASGAGRMQILDRNWIVCQQNLAPATTANQDSDISFAVVKLDEDCP
jgi:hypothetical protein